MIDVKLLTPENGFVEGCVVEIETVDGFTMHEKIRGFGDTCIFFEFYDHPMIGIEHIEYVRPLTGPMAIWNFIPENINSADDLLDCNQWYSDLSGQFKRPFWARGKV